MGGRSFGNRCVVFADLQWILERTYTKMRSPRAGEMTQPLKELAALAEALRSVSSIYNRLTGPVSLTPGDPTPSPGFHMYIHTCTTP